MITHLSRDWSCTDHVAIMHCSRGLSCSDHVAIMHYSLGWSCNDHVATNQVTKIRLLSWFYKRPSLSSHHQNLWCLSTFPDCPWPLLRHEVCFLFYCFCHLMNRRTSQSSLGSGSGFKQEQRALDWHCQCPLFNKYYLLRTYCVARGCGIQCSELIVINKIVRYSCTSGADILVGGDRQQMK